MLKKTIRICFMFALLWVYSVHAEDVKFLNDIKKGQSGSDVVMLQTFLIGAGYHIPSIESGAFAKGYFGNETLKAVRLYQSEHSIPTTGFVGPLTRASLNSSNPVASVSQQLPTTGAGGLLAITLQAAPTNATPLNKGQEGDVVSYKIQAGTSDMRLTSLSLDFNNRLWLYADTVTVLDGITPVATISGLSVSNFTEITAGSSYRLLIPTNIVIRKGETKYFTIRLKMLKASDRSSATTISITQIQTRAIDGKGDTDTQTLTSTRTFRYTGRNHGGITIVLNPQSPPNMVVPISTAGPTDNIVFAAVDFISKDMDTTIRKVTLYMNTSVDGVTPITDIVGDLKLQIGEQIYSADSITAYTSDAGVSTFVFNNMSVPLPKDKPTTVVVLLKIKQDINNSLDGISASTTLNATGSNGGTDNNPVIEDESHTTVAATNAPFLSSDLTFTAKSSGVDYTAPAEAKLGSPILVSGTTTAYPVSFTFSITAGSMPLFVSADPNQALSTSSTGLPSSAYATLPISGVVTDPPSLAGDTNTSSITGYYIIPADSTRKFTYGGSISNSGGTSGTKTFKITAIKYGTTTSNLTANTIVYYNYAVFKVNPVF